MLTGAAKLPAVENLIAQLGRPANIAFSNPAGNSVHGQSPTIKPGQTQIAQVAQVAPAVPADNAPSPSKQDVSGKSNNGNGSRNSAVQSVQSKPQSIDTGNNVSPTPGTTKEPEGQITLTSVPMVITTTTIKLNVTDTIQAQSAAMSIANSIGATLASEESAQDSEHPSLLFLNFTVDSGQASAFLDRLSSLGGIASEDSTSKNVSNDYATDMEKYQALEAQQLAAADSDKGQYTSQINMVKSELNGWQNESGKQVIMLWLMQ
jgi:hypothetical protein